MKYLKIKIKRGDPKKGEHMMVYPDVYDPQEVETVKIGPILYSGKIGQGASEEYCIVCFSNDETANTYIKEGKGDITELSADEVDAWMKNEWEGKDMSEEQVTDPDRIQAIIAKKHAGISLSQEDIDALNPDKPVRGINRINKDHNIFLSRFKIQK